MIWQSSSFFLAGNAKRLQCADPVTVSTASNNTYCAFNGAIIMTAVHAAVLWAGYMICNLHATIVWRSNVFERFKPLGVILCWGLPGVFTFIPFLVSTIDAVTGMTCIISPDKANLLFFSFQAPVVVISFILNLATMIHILIVARRSSSMGSSNGYSGNGYSNNGSSTKPLSARRQMIQLLKLNWRALLLGLIFLMTYVSYVIFFNLVVAPIANTDTGTKWIMEWVGCMITTKGDQNLCAERFASYIPSFPAIVIANATTASTGFWIFIIFGFNLQIWRDWGAFITGGCCCGGRRRRRQQGDYDDDVEWK
jgi:hypothetical protein